ncbi:hypothetical protein AM571_PC00281 (plasmid) [Rhizobium etli 8C-3]|uniref:Uncharacterized protein n=1 Tax=Rhizobium etli 8C-3 TaxID=538025 RepID=A0A1L5PCU9_RHIET|nr:hypothetical protein AM571_PC00281 [Rhizobium etli 8C-3]
MLQPAAHRAELAAAVHQNMIIGEGSIEALVSGGTGAGTGPAIARSSAPIPPKSKAAAGSLEMSPG